MATLKQRREAAAELPCRYKIHALNGIKYYARNGHEMSGNSRFYADENVALRRAASYVADGGNAMVIFEAKYILRPETKPVEVLQIDAASLKPAAKKKVARRKK